MPTTQELIKEIEKDLHEEMLKIKEKLPWWKQTIVWVGTGIAAGYALAACGLITVATIGTGTLPCVLALIALAVVLASLISHLAGNQAESDAMDVKLEQLKALKRVSSPSGLGSESD